MSTSGTYNYNETCTEIVTDAYELIGVSGLGRTLASEDMSKGVRFLNKMIKSWTKQGLHLWTKEEGVVYLTPYEASYSLGNATDNAYATNISDEIITKLSSSLVTNATSVTVLSTTGMLVGDYIGIVLTDKTVHWTTIAAIPTSTTLTLTLGVASASASGNLVYTFTNKLYKPVRILSARLVSGYDSGSSSTITEILMSPISYSDYMDYPMKTANGNPNQYCYDPKLTKGNLYLWLRPNDGNYRVHFTYERYIEDMISLINTPDFPQEWLEPITWQLALRLGVAYGKKQRVSEILPIASMMLQNILDADVEITSIFSSPEGE